MEYLNNDVDLINEIYTNEIYTKVNPLVTGLNINCDELTFNVRGIKMIADLSSLENIEEIIINGIKFVRCR